MLRKLEAVKPALLSNTTVVVPNGSDNENASSIIDRVVLLAKNRMNKIVSETLKFNMDSLLEFVTRI